MTSNRNWLFFLSCNRAFQQKMKILLICCALWIINGNVKACEVRLWRVQEIFCCPNVTAFGTGASRIWVSQKPLLCSVKKEHGQKQGRNGWMIAGIIISVAGFMFCMCQCCYAYLGKRLLCSNQENDQPQN